MAEPTFKPRYSGARICIFIHSALEIFYSILKCLSNREEADSVVSLRKSSLHYIQNEVLGFPYVKVRAAGEQGVGVGRRLRCFPPSLRQPTFSARGSEPSSCCLPFLPVLSTWIFTGTTDAEAPILWHLMQRADSLEKTLKLGKTEGRRGPQMIWLDGIINSRDVSLSKLRANGEGEGSLACYSPQGH